MRPGGNCKKSLLLPVVGGGEELAGWLAGESLEVVGEMCLIEIAGRVGDMCEGGGFFGVVVIDDMTQTNDRREVFCGYANGFTESFFEGVLADIELFCKTVDRQCAFCCPEYFYGLADEGVGGRCYFGAEELLDGLCPFGVGGHFRELFGFAVYAGVAFEFCGRDAFLEKFL